MRIPFYFLLIALVLVLLCSQVYALPRPEYPFPQAQRTEWLNLNGTWEFAETDEYADATYLGDKPYPDKIVVPYCRESKLSGLERKGFIKNVWYRRTFELQKNWHSPRTILHIGACDWKTRVWLNGSYLGEHTGGSAPVSFEITKYLKSGANTIIITAYDDVRSGLQASGKQSQNLESNGCVYTRTTGIWQTVWLEGVGRTYIKDFRIEPDPANSRILVQADVDGKDRDVYLSLAARANGKVVGQTKIPANWRNTQAVLNLSEKHLWSIKAPFLYDLDVKLVKNGKVLDSVKSYFGLRDIAINGTDILINGKPVFQRLVLDQGFYPDGIWTAPTDADLKGDIILSMNLGFNGARLHQKVFDPRYLYWADRLGYLVWGEFPNWGVNYGNPVVNLPIINEWGEILRRDRNHPSIVGWCPFNETYGQANDLQDTVVRLTRLIDPSRPVIDTSGWTHSISDPEVLDIHDYEQNPDNFRTRYNDIFNQSGIPTRYGCKPQVSIPFFVSEYGGIPWITKGGWGYGKSPKDLEDFYMRYAGLTYALLDSRAMFGFCYTQLTDVEQEQNGMYTYDRKPKFDVKRIHAINSRIAACEEGTLAHTEKDDWHVLVGANPDKVVAREWSYTTDKPSDVWYKPGFDDSSWKIGLGGFGTKGGWEWAIRTPWKTKDIWLRQGFDYDGKPFSQAMLVVHFDDSTEIYVNGTKVWSRTGWSDGYTGFYATKAIKTALKPGKNIIAVHCWQDWGGQFIDMALLVK